MPGPRVRPPLFILGILVSCLILPGASWGHRENPEAVLKEIGVDERQGARVPGDLAFRTAEGASVRLGDYLGDGPVILTLNYYSCPMLCPLTLRSLAEGLKGVEGISPARDFRILTVSIDPQETPEAAGRQARAAYRGIPDVPDPSARWPFLFGDASAVRSLTEAVGFRYRKVGAEFAHPSVFILLTPEGTVSRYLYGIEQTPRDLRLALVEAAGGRIGKSAILHRALLLCFQYDPVGRKYVLYARNIMTGGGALTLILAGGVLFILWRRERVRAPGRDGRDAG